jgi:hypothetical protein
VAGLLDDIKIRPVVDGDIGQPEVQEEWESRNDETYYHQRRGNQRATVGEKERDRRLAQPQERGDDCGACGTH